MKLNKYTLAIEPDDDVKDIPQDLKTEELIDDQLDSFLNEPVSEQLVIELEKENDKAEH